MIQSETKTYSPGSVSAICQNCKNQFVIEPEDFTFYERVKVPPPTWCPECRQRRRYAWRNERTLYRRNCDLCGKSTVTIYSPNKPFKVYCPPCWWSDKWSAFDYEQDFDFSKPFFPQWHELQLKIPRIALLTKNSTGSEYTNHSNNNKNCYLCFGVFDSENLMYSSNVYDGARDTADCYRLTKGNDLLYECVDVAHSYQSQFLLYSRECTNCFYCYDCRNCQNCFLSSNLRNKQYYFLNQPYSKEEYERKLEGYRLGSYETRKKLYGQFRDLIEKKSIHRFAVIERSTNVSGSFIINSKNSHHVFDAEDAEDTKYAIVCPDVKSSMDSYHYGFRCELIYECHALIHDYDVMFTHLSYDDSHLQYCDGCHNSENLFGCVGVKQGKYCIMNKRYEENEYETLKSKIIAHMKKTGEYGEFFPTQLSPFGYNETVGMIYMPMSKDEAIDRGYKWENLTPGTLGKETLKPEDISDDVVDIKDSILKEALVCIKCHKNYNVVEPELQLYRHEYIPIPRLCPECRHLRRLELRSPRKLWHRQCVCDYSVYKNTSSHLHHPNGKCPNEFETPYAPERKEIVYCESCYNSEIV